MDRHFELLGYFFYAYGALLLLIGLVVVLGLTGAGLASGDAEAAGILAAVSGTVGLVLLVLALPYLAAGYGLHRRQAWGRVLAIVLGALALLSFPVGTALGVYALWALTKPEARLAFS